MPLRAISEDSAKLQTFGVFFAGLAATIALLYFGRAFCITLVVAVLLTFLLEPFVRLCMRARLPRGAAALVVCTIAVLGLYLLGFAIFTQFASFSEDLPEYSQRLNVIVDRIGAQLDTVEQNLYRLLVPKRFQEKPQQQGETPPNTGRRKRNQPPPPPVPPPVTEVRIHQEREPVLNHIASYFSSFYNTLLMISFVPFLIFFMLSWRDHISRTFLAIFEAPDRARAGRSWQVIADMARAYVVGNVILGLIISVASCVVFYSWHLPYWLMIGFVSGFLSLVPYVGLPLAIVPAIVSALLMYDAITPYVVISLEVGVIHLLAQNLLYPAVVGARVHLNPLAVTVALMFWGTIWGGIGLVLAIPVTAAIKAYLDNTEALEAYGRLLGDQTPVVSEYPLRTSSSSTLAQTRQA